MNICTFSGRIVADATTKYTQQGTAVSNFRVAVDSGYGAHKRTDFISCVLWKRESIIAHLTKGKAIMFSGEYLSREYESKDGQKQRVVEIVVNAIDFQQGQSQQGKPQQDLGPAFPSEPTFPGETGGIEDVPF